MFATLGLARMEFLLNTFEEVTRRAASATANADYGDDVAMQNVRADGMFRQSRGPLLMGDPVTAENIKIDYLSVSKATLDLARMSSLPICPEGIRSNCMTVPHGANCIRFVRAQICAAIDSESNCSLMPYQMVFPFLDLGRMKLPSAETVVAAGSLGATLGALPCP